MATGKKTSRRRFVAGVGGMATAGLLTANQPARAAYGLQDSTPQRGGQLTILVTNDFVSMDPIHASGPTARATYDWLLAWRPNAQGEFGVQPMLATEWETSGNTLVFKLREGIKFHDGSDLNADVVVWNLQRMVQNPESFAKNYLPAIDEGNPAEALDPLTVQVNLTRPSAAILSSLSDAVEQTPIVSKQAADDNGEEWLKNNPVGTGPFKFVEWASGNKLEVMRNESYWQIGEDGEPLPYVDGITYRNIIEVSTQFAEMRAGTADLMTNVRGRDVPTAKEIPHAVYVEAPYLGLKRQYFFNSLKGPFQDNLSLRQAFHHAIDREAIARALGSDLGQPLPYEFVPGTLGYDDSVPFYEFDLEKAKALIEEAGVETPIDVQLTVHSREVDQQQAQIIQAMVAEVGFNVSLDVVERVAWGEKVRIQNDFEMATRQSGVAVDPTNDLLVTWAPGGNSAYHRATVPNLLETIRAADSTYEPEERHRLFVEAQKLMHESAWFGYMWFETGNFLRHQRIQNFPIIDDLLAIWGSLREEEWWLEE
ncbi:MAG: ABC transporter substrate-binding protein [Thermomicrobiales bacterium]